MFGLRINNISVKQMLWRGKFAQGSFAFLSGGVAAFIFPPFVSNLFGYVGGNTPCVELKDDLLNKKNEYILFDAGSGIVEFGRGLNFRLNPSGNVFHIFISHFHWDHIHGLPFFTPGYNSGNVIHFYSTRKEMKEM